MDDYFAAKASLFDARAGRRRRWSTPTTRGAGACWTPARLPTRAVLPGRRRRPRASAADGSHASGGTGSPVRLRLGGTLQRGQRPGRGHRRPRARRRRRRRSPTGLSSAWRRCPAASSPSTGASPSRCSSTTPTPPPAWSSACGRPAGWPAATGGCVVVFGCGGDRDHAKRPLMGEVAARLADLAVLTSDNPRSEDPAAIIDAGPGRRAPARGARRSSPTAGPPSPWPWPSARPGDVVVLAGKGHETTQVIGDRVVPFDDRVVAAEELDRLAGGAGALDGRPPHRRRRRPARRHPGHAAPHPLPSRSAASASRSARTGPRATSPRRARPPWAASPSWRRRSSATWPPTSAPARSSPPPASSSSWSSLGAGLRRAARRLDQDLPPAQPGPQQDGQDASACSSSSSPSPCWPSTRPRSAPTCRSPASLGIDLTDPVYIVWAVAHPAGGRPTR